MARLGDYVRIRTGKLDANAASPNGRYPFFTCAVEPLRIDSYSYDCECVLVAGNGDLNVKYYRGQFDAYQRTYIIESKNKQILDTYFLYLFLDKYIEVLRRDSIGGVIKYIKLGNLTEANIPLPDLPTQRRIAATLDKVSEGIDLCRKMLADLDVLVKARFFEMFGDPTINSHNLPQKTLPELGENLDSRRIPITSSDRKTGQYPYYGASGIVDYVADFIFDEDILLISEDGANLLARVTPIAFPASGKVWVNNHAHVMRFDSMAKQVYIEYLLNMIDISNYVTGTAQPKLNQAKMNTIPIPVPEEAQMERFREFTEQADKSKFAIQQQLSALETLKKSLMQEYFGYCERMA